MSLETNRKILIGSLSNTLDKRRIIGDTFDKSYLNIVLLLVDRIDYCLKQVAKGLTEYNNYITTLTDQLNTLKYKCPSVCIYKDRLILRGSINTAPSISDNIIRVPFDNEIHLLEFLEVVKDFSDNENDFISEVVLLSEDSDTNLFIGSSNVIINHSYDLPLEVSISYTKDPTKEYLIKNLNGDPCTAEIVEIDKTLYNTYKQDSKVLETSSLTSKTVFQRLTTETVVLPNDSIIYVHIDTTSMGATDQDTISVAVIDWYTQFKIDNPDFTGSLVINTTDNQDIDNDYAIGRGGGGTGGGVATTGLALITGSNIKSYEIDVSSTEPQEYWLQNPAEGLLRQAWKEGIDTFTDESDFFNYIDNKSLVVLSFVDESSNKYHDSQVFFEGVTPEPSFSYRTDYANFINKIRSNLKFFKGILYPVTNPTREVNRAFLLHAIAAIEAEPLATFEFRGIIGQEKAAAIDAASLLTLELQILTTPSPYAEYSKLKQSGWSGNFTKVASETGDNFDAIEFAEELDELLTETGDITINTIELIEVDSVNLGTEITTNFTLKVKDNNINPLYSNIATIDVEHYGICENIPICNVIEQKTIGTGVYTFTEEDFITEDFVDKITIISITVPEGSLEYFGISLRTSILPIAISKDEITSGELKYIPEDNNIEDYSILINYKVSYEDSINYCENTNRIQLDKSENTNQAPIIQVTDLTLEKSFADLTTNGKIETSIFYTGTGDYTITWAQISGPNTAVLVDDNAEDLEIENLIEGSYEFIITVNTNVNNFTVTETANVVVTIVSSQIIFGANITELENTALDTEVGDVLDVLQQGVDYSNPLSITCTSDNNDVDNFTYIAYKNSQGTVTSIVQNSTYEVLGAFEDLGTFNYNDGSGVELWRVFRTNAPGAFADQVLLTITF